MTQTKTRKKALKYMESTRTELHDAHMTYMNGCTIQQTDSGSLGMKQR